MRSGQLTTMEELNRHLQEHGVKPSYQRTRIFEYLLTNLTHPTVDEIYQSLSDHIPTLSKTTVYNTLRAFMDAHLVRLVNIEDHEARYDVDLSMHGHFKCENCQQIFDFDLDLNQLNTPYLNAFLIKDRHVNYVGTCKYCMTGDKHN